MPILSVTQAPARFVAHGTLAAGEGPHGICPTNMAFAVGPFLSTFRSPWSSSSMNRTALCERGLQRTLTFRALDGPRA